MENAFNDLCALHRAAKNYEYDNEFLKAALIWQLYNELFDRANPMSINIQVKTIY